MEHIFGVLKSFELRQVDGFHYDLVTEFLTQLWFNFTE